MESKGGEYQQIIEFKRFSDDIEQAIRFANREIIHKRIPNLCRDDILSFAVTVGRLRARYLEAAFKLAVNEHGDPPNQAEITELKTRREMFEEGKSAFEALSYAIERGYIDVKELQGSSD